MINEDTTPTPTMETTSSSSSTDEASLESVSCDEDLPKSEEIEALEHVIRMGYFWKQKHDRFIKWRKQKDFPTTESTVKSALALNGKIPTEQSWNQARVDGYHTHVGDTRVYGTDGCFEKHPWPRNPQQGRLPKTEIKYEFPAPDNHWDAEFGDGIHPVAFSSNKLASFVPEAKISESTVYRHGFASADLDPEALKCDVASTDAAMALTLRSWDRAVHAVSSIVMASGYSSVSDNQTSAPIPARAVRLTKTRRICRRLGIKSPRFPKNQTASRKCPVCKAPFSTQANMNAHFYGKLKATRGCCWNLILEKEQSCIDRVLSSVARCNVESLLQLVVAGSRHRKQHSVDGKILNWQDILDMLQHAIDSSQVATIDPTLPPIFETMEMTSSPTSLLLNQSILDLSRKRLVDRYADVSR